MKFSRGKGQGALEYIQTYAWAILVVLIVGVVLWQLGVFGSHRGPNTSSGFAAMKILSPSIAYRADTEDNALNFSFVNAAGLRARGIYTLKNVSGDCSTILLDYTELTLSEASCNVLEDPNYGVYIPVNTCWVNQPISLEPGDTTKPIYTRCTSLDVGDMFIVHVTFQYSERVGSGDPTTHFDGGTIMGTVEE